MAIFELLSGISHTPLILAHCTSLVSKEIGDSVSFCIRMTSSHVHRIQSWFFWAQRGWICCWVLLLVWSSGSGSIGSCVSGAHAQCGGRRIGGGSFGPRTNKAALVKWSHSPSRTPINERNKTGYDRCQTTMSTVFFNYNTMLYVLWSEWFNIVWSVRIRYPPQTPNQEVCE